MKIIMIDVDNTVVASAWEWTLWMDEFNERADEYKGLDLSKIKIPYDCSKMFKQNPMIMPLQHFWHQKDLYDYMRPITGAVNAIQNLAHNDFHIVFCSVCMDNHWMSKKKFIQKYFHEDAHIILTDDPMSKQMVRADYVIDDRQEVLDSFYDDAVTIRFNSPYEQYKHIGKPDAILDSWDEIEKWINTREKHL